jgi:hypothetical protein
MIAEILLAAMLSQAPTELPKPQPMPVPKPTTELFMEAGEMTKSEDKIK